MSKTGKLALDGYGTSCPDMSRAGAAEVCALQDDDRRVLRAYLHKSNYHLMAACHQCKGFHRHNIKNDTI